MAVYYPKHTDSPKLDYTIGTCLIIIFIVSTTLNPLSFLYHIQRDSKLSSRLYALLAIFDLMVNIYGPLFQAHNFFKPIEEGNAETAEIYEKIVQGIGNFSAWSSQITINIIVFVRLYKIKFPFRRVNTKFIAVFLTCFALGLIVIESLYLHEANYWFSEIQQATSFLRSEDKDSSVSDLYGCVLTGPMAFVYFLGGISAFYTVYLLMRDTGPEETRKQKRKSVRTILILSIMNWSVPIGIVYTIFNWPTVDFSFPRLVGGYLVLTGVEKIVSVLDPIVILLLSKDMRSYCKDLAMRGYRSICNTIIRVGQSPNENTRAEPEL